MRILDDIVGAELFRLGTVWVTWLLFSISSMATQDDVDTAVTKWENTIQPWLKQVDIEDRNVLLVLEESILRDRNCREIKIDSSWTLSFHWQQIIEAGYPLFDSPPEPTAAALRLRLKSDAPGLRGLALIYLRVLKDDKCLPELIHMMEHDANVNVRKLAIRELGQARFEPAILPLISILDRTKSLSGAESALKQFGPTAVGGLLDTLRDLKDKEEQVYRLQLIGQLGDDKKLDRLFPLVRDRDVDDRIRGQASILLGKFGYGKIVPELLRICDEERFRNRTDICLPIKEALEMLGEPAVKQIAEEISNSKDADYTCNLLWTLMRNGSASAVPIMTQCLENTSWNVRSHAISTLRHSLGKEAVPLVLPLTDDPDQRVAESALHTIEEIAERKFASAADARAWAEKISASPSSIRKIK